MRFPVRLSVLGRGGGGEKPEVWMKKNGWVCIGVRDEILAQNVYCAKPNPDPDAQYSSQVRKGIGDRSPWSILEYYLATAIDIRTLNQPVTCEMGFPSFVAMSWLKVASTTIASFPIIPSTERTNGEKFLRCQYMPAHVLPSCFYPKLPKIIHYNWIPSLRVSIYKPDVKNRFYLALP